MINNRILLLSALCLLVVGYNFWVFAWHGFFYQCVALGLLVLTFLVKRLMPNDPTATIAVWLCFNNVLDELFFDPKSFGWNEYAIAAIIVVVTIRNSKKDARRRKQHPDLFDEAHYIRNRRDNRVGRKISHNQQR